MALALCGAASPDDQRLIDRCLGDGDAAGFAARFLHAKGLGWAADLLARWTPPAVPAKPSQALNEPPVEAPAAEKPALDATPPNEIREPSSGASEGGETAAATPATSAPVAPRKPVLATAAPGRPVTPLPGLPGGPPLSERLSPFRIVAGKANRRHP